MRKVVLGRSLGCLARLRLDDHGLVGAARRSGAGTETNVGWLLMLNIAIATAAIRRLAEGTHRAEGLPVLIVSGIAAAVMLAAALVLRSDPGGEDDAEEDLNVKAVLLDTAAAAAALWGRCWL